ncbi:hypothetical protein ACFYWX_11230 [Streptomyces sp. NPDC002888]|uniref:hypothetical protein n=1 Tax=Streptomyces sp. NPDC002888 TaxID=3364668 RepID=UPI003678283B
MPFPSPSRAPSGPRRRALFASAAGAALLVGCSSPGDSGSGTSRSPSATERARARAARDSAGLVERYDAVITVHPALAERLRPLRAAAVRHGEAFRGARGAGSPTASPSPGTSRPSPSLSPPASVPGNEKDALADLAAAERALSDRRTTALLAVPGELARLLASVAAAGAAHAYLLTESAR